MPEDLVMHFLKPEIPRILVFHYRPTYTENNSLSSSVTFFLLACKLESSDLSPSCSEWHD